MRKIPELLFISFNWFLKMLFPALEAIKLRINHQDTEPEKKNSSSIIFWKSSSPAKIAKNERIVDGLVRVKKE